MNTTSIILASLASLFMNASLLALDNVYVAEKTPGTLVNVDDATIRDRPSIEIVRPFPVRQAWFTSTVSTKTRWSSRLAQLISVDCDAEKIAILKSVEYLPDDKMGTNVDQPDRTDSYEYAVPQSVGYKMVRALCDA